MASVGSVSSRFIRCSHCSHFFVVQFGDQQTAGTSKTGKVGSDGLQHKGETNKPVPPPKKVCLSVCLFNLFVILSVYNQVNYFSFKTERMGVIAPLAYFDQFSPSHW